MRVTSRDQEVIPTWSVMQNVWDPISNQGQGHSMLMCHSGPECKKTHLSLQKVSVPILKVKVAVQAEILQI